MANILIVDDDKNLVELMQFVLQKENHTICIARDGKAGLAMAKQKKPDLIVLDVMMPEMDGFSVSGSLFKDPAMRHTPILILTAQGHSREIFELVPNVRLHMDKPFDLEVFAKNVRKLLPPKAKAA